MPFNPSGSRPIICVKFDAKIPPPDVAETGACTIFIKKDSTWKEIASFVNRPFSTHYLVLDPSIFLNSGDAVAELKNSEIRYQAFFIDNNDDKKVSCSFDFEISQDEIILISDSKKEKTQDGEENEFFFFSNTFTLTE
jgi:hypothetical protein